MEKDLSQFGQSKDPNGNGNYPSVDNIVLRTSSDSRILLVRDQSHTGSMTFPMTYDYDYDGFFSSKRSGWRGLSSLEKSLSIALGLVSLLAIALMIALIIVGVKLNKDDYNPPEKLVSSTLYPPWVSTILTTTTPCNNEVTTRERPTTLYPPSTTEMYKNNSGSEPESCESQQCRQIIRSMDITVDPCDDFYHFSCGDWVIEAPMTQDKLVVDQFTKMHESFKTDVKSILERNNQSEELELEALNLAKQFYWTCLNDTEINTDTIRQLIDGIFSTFDYTTEGLISILSQIRRELNGNYLFSLRVEEHLEMNLQNAVYLSYPDLTVAKEIFHSPNETQRLDAYKEFMVELWKATFQEDSNTTAEIVDNLIEFEESLLQISGWNSSEYELVKKAEIISLNDHKLKNYTELLLIVNKTMNLNEKNCSGSVCFLEKDVDVILTDANFSRRVHDFVNEMGINATVNYLKWRVILDFAKHSNEQFRNLYDKQILGSDITKPRWEMCVEEAIDFFGPPIISAFIHENIVDPIGFKQQVSDMADYLKQTILEMTQEATWIKTNSTREHIYKKLEELQIFAVYPLSLTDENINFTLDFYSELNFSNPSSHFQNMLDLTKWESRSQLKLIWKDANETMLRKELEVQTLSEIWFSPFSNSLYLPTAAFLPPIYTNEENGSIAFNYGSMGTLIGRQLMEAFENTAMAYYNGSLVGVWDEETLKNFHGSIACLEENYNAYNVSQIDTSYVIHDKTVKMNTVDVGGFKVALKSFMYAKAFSDESKIQGLDFSTEQLFWIGFAQNWCALDTEESFLQETWEGSQTPVPYRVNQLLDYFPEFAETWNCSKPINTDNVCRLLW